MSKPYVKPEFPAQLVGEALGQQFMKDNCKKCIHFLEGQTEDGWKEWCDLCHPMPPVKQCGNFLRKPEKYVNWVCGRCGHLVVSKEKPRPIRWTDGHVCYFRPEREEDDE